jgi:hypothetical protein
VLQPFKVFMIAQGKRLTKPRSFCSPQNEAQPPVNKHFCAARASARDIHFHTPNHEPAKSSHQPQPPLNRSEERY